MTREEAIEMLKALNMMLRSPDGEPISDVCEAIDMAIEALKTDAEPKWNCTANFVAEQLNKLEDMTVSEKLKLIQDILGVEVKEENLNYKHASADAVSEDTQTEEQARFVAKETELAHIEARLENAEKRLQGVCVANFVAEQLERLKDMTDEERLKLLQTMFPSTDAVMRDATAEERARV